MILKPMTDRRWRGYSFDELQDQILITDARIEVRKKKLAEKVGELRASTEQSQPVSGAIKAFRYIKTGVAAFRKIRMLISRFRK